MLARSKARQVGRVAPEARAYVKQEAAAGRVPSKRGALRVAKARTPKGGSTKKRTAPKSTVGERAYRVGQRKAQHRSEQVLAALTAVDRRNASPRYRVGTRHPAAYRRDRRGIPEMRPVGPVAAHHAG